MVKRQEDWNDVMPGSTTEVTQATADARRGHYRENMRDVFAATADLYYQRWGEFFHFAIFNEGDDPYDFDAALERTHQRYFNAIHGAEAKRILELASGGGAFSEWMAKHTTGEVIGVDISPAQLEHARNRLKGGGLTNLYFLEHDVMRISEIRGESFDAAICLDAACYFPDKRAALKGISSRLRPGGRFLLVDWCRAEKVTRLQEEMVLEPFYRYWCIPEMETVGNYRRAFKTAGFRLLELNDLSSRIAPNWERGYRIAPGALAEGDAQQLLTIAASALNGSRAVRIAKDQFYAAVLAKVAADAGLLKYVLFLGERL